ncbi:MAG: UPF0182 family protein [Gemmatimonadaceae bacterium]
MTRRRWLVLAIALAAAVLLVGRVIAGWVVDYRWYDALGAASVWKARALNLTLLRGGTFLAGFLFVFANLFAVRSSIQSLVLPRRVANLEIGEEVPSRRLTWAVVIVAALVAALLASIQDNWTALELVRHGQRFGDTDPYFQYDLAFYVYWLPLELSLHVGALITDLVVSVLVILLYALTPSLRWEHGRLVTTGHVRRHLFALGAVLLVLLAWSYRLDAHALLIEGHGERGAFTALDKEFRQPANLVLAMLTLAAAALVLWSGWMAQTRFAFVAVTMVLIGAFTVRQVVPPILQRTSLSADAIARERPYLETRAAYTRRGFETERIAHESSFAKLPELSAAVRGVSAFDEAPLIRDAERLRRRGRVSGSVGWEMADDHLAALVAEQPAGPEGLDPATPWSIARANATGADDRGLPMFLDVLAHDGGTTVAPALVHDSIAGYVITADSLGAVAATELTSFGARLAHAWHLQDPRLLFGDLPQPRPRIILRRDVRQRVNALFPAFEVGSLVRPVAHNDSLYWALHLYATSPSYPLSEPIEWHGIALHYLRHAGVALVNATTGRVWAVRDDNDDPITNSWARRFPELFVSRSTVPPAFLRRIAPAIEGAYIQAQAFARYGRRGDVAPPSRLPRATGGEESFGAYAATPAFDVARLTLAWTIPVLDAADRVRGVYVASGAGMHDASFIDAGRLTTRWPLLTEELQRAGDFESPAGFSRGGQTAVDARPVRGPVRVIPHSRGVAFAQTTYAPRGDGTLAITRVVVRVGDSLHVGESLIGALGITSALALPPPATAGEFRERVESLYRRMRDALQRGDWFAFGEAYEALGRLLRNRAP